MMQNCGCGDVFLAENIFLALTIAFEGDRCLQLTKTFH